jgi:hypothetical protein
MPEYNRPWPTPLALFLGGIAKQNGITPRGIGGVADHVHLLLSLPTTVPIAKAIQLVKAGSLTAPPGFRGQLCRIHSANRSWYQKVGQMSPVFADSDGLCPGGGAAGLSPAFQRREHPMKRVRSERA